MQTRYSIQMRKQKPNKIVPQNVERIFRSFKSSIDNYNHKNQTPKDIADLHITANLQSYTERLNPSKTQRKSVSINTLHKERIIKQRRSYSFVQKKNSQNINLSNNITRYHSHKQSININQNNKNNKNQINPNSIILTLVKQCKNLSQIFQQKCMKGDFTQCFNCLVILLNYVIDLSVLKWFLKIILAMCQFYQNLQQTKIALKYYQQLRQASLLSKNYQYLIMSLIGIARCATKNNNLVEQSIIILKKALEYAWYINNIQLELNVYDELGEKYYKMGQIQRASVYHKKYSGSITQQKDSPLRLLSKQKIGNLQQKYLNVIYQNFSVVFLTHLNLPIKSSFSIKPLADLPTIRNKIQQNNRFNFELHEIPYQIRRIMKTWIFQTQTEEPSLQNVREKQSKNFHSQKKYAYSQIRMKRQLKPKQIKQAAKVNILMKSYFLDQLKRKSTLDQQVKTFIESPGLSKNWYQNIVKKVKISQVKDSHINDPVRVTKNTTKLKHKKQTISILFRQLIQYFSSQKVKNLLSTKILTQNKQ